MSPVDGGTDIQLSMNWDKNETTQHHRLLLCSSYLSVHKSYIYFIHIYIFSFHEILLKKMCQLSGSGTGRVGGLRVGFVWGQKNPFD